MLLPLDYAGDPRQAAGEVAALESAGLDAVWVAEAYGFHVPTLAIWPPAPSA